MKQADLFAPGPRPTPNAWAVFSSETPPVYRYLLGRRIAPTGPHGLVVMVNPSTAGAYRPDGREDNDPTVTNLKARAACWGWGSFEVANLFALISSDPKALRDPRLVREVLHNDLVLGEAIGRAEVLVAAWGNAGAAFPARVDAVLTKMLARADVHCLGRCAGGAPTHPLARGLHLVHDATPLQLFSLAPRG
jgi:hypothetical protein